MSLCGAGLGLVLLRPCACAAVGPVAVLPHYSATRHDVTALQVMTFKTLSYYSATRNDVTTLLSYSATLYNVTTVPRYTLTSPRYRANTSLAVHARRITCANFTPTIR
uniref:Secreted protein n=1 Tax=Pectinophora gossypiella TaxID=13191 RepID=A0A1E1WSI3_PECGO